MLQAALCRKMNPIGIAFGPGVADIRLRALKGSRREERTSGKAANESRAGYISRVSINRKISLCLGIDRTRGESEHEKSRFDRG